MAKYRRNDGLSYKAIWINGHPVRKSLINKTWTKLAKECYERKCNCHNCYLVPKLDSISHCRIKDYVMAYIKLGYYPQDDDDESEDEYENK